MFHQRHSLEQRKDDRVPFCLWIASIVVADQWRSLAVFVDGWICWLFPDPQLLYLMILHNIHKYIHEEQKLASGKQSLEPLYKWNLLEKSEMCLEHFIFSNCISFLLDYACFIDRAWARGQPPFRFKLFKTMPLRCIWCEYRDPMKMKWCNEWSWTLRKDEKFPDSDRGSKWNGTFFQRRQRLARLDFSLA